MLDFLKYIFFPAISILVSLYTIYRNDQASLKASEKAEESTKKAEESRLKAEESRLKAQEATDLANRINNGQIELSVATLITQTENRVMDIALEMAKYVSSKQTLSESEKTELSFYEKAYNQAIQSNLNAYEEACAKYRDGKIDKERFKRMYDRPIRQLVENDELREYFTPQLTSSFKCILKVYEEWNDHEK